MTGQIKISNKSKKITQIDIEGIIGLPEDKQFGENGTQVATYQKLRETIKAISDISSKEIVVNIRSTGGSVNDALLIYDSLASLDCVITTRCYGYVASAATIIAQAASKGRREISENALYLIHRSTSCGEGNAEQLSQTIELLEKTDRRISAIYSSRSGLEEEVFGNLMKENNGNGRWLSPDEVMELRLADKMIAPSKISNDAMKMIATLDLPEIPDHNRSMSIRKHWNAILDLIRSPQNIETEKSEKIDCGEKELENEIINYETPRESQAIAELKNRIVELEAMNAKLRAKATQTFPKEDPSLRDIKTEANAEAYRRDLNNFRR